MCDPLVGGLLGAIGSIASAGINYSQQQDMMNKQNDANAQWIAYQRQQSQEAFARDQENRAKAQTAMDTTQQQISANQQKTQQQTEQDRLNTALTPEQLAAQSSGDPNAIAGQLLSGQKNAAAPVKAAIGQQIASAAQDARSRIAALATLQSYGPSQFGLTNYTNTAFQQGNQGIDLYNNYRRGDLAAYSVAKNVEPIKYQSTPSPFGSIANSLAGIAGKAFGGGGYASLSGTI
jgi:hypothetical protein